MRIEITLCQFLDGDTSHRISIHVLFLIDRLQLTLEKTKYGIYQTLTIDLGPLGDILRRECIEI